MSSEDNGLPLRSRPKNRRREEAERNTRSTPWLDDEGLMRSLRARQWGVAFPDPNTSPESPFGKRIPLPKSSSLPPAVRIVDPNGHKYLEPHKIEYLWNILPETVATWGLPLWLAMSVTDESEISFGPPGNPVRLGHGRNLILIDLIAAHGQSTRNGGELSISGSGHQLGLYTVELRAWNSSSIGAELIYTSTYAPLQSDESEHLPQS